MTEKDLEKIFNFMITQGYKQEDEDIYSRSFKLFDGLKLVFMLNEDCDTFLKMYLTKKLPGNLKVIYESESTKIEYDYSPFEAPIEKDLVEFTLLISGFLKMKESGLFSNIEKIHEIPGMIKCLAKYNHSDLLQIKLTDYELLKYFEGNEFIHLMNRCPE